jgi:anaerobic ribonucleoside-triphosphate reductase
MFDLLPKVFTSKGTEEKFNPERIMESLLEETDIKPKEAQEIAIELTRRVIAYKIKVLTSPEIRELVCSILLEKGFNNARFRYTRLGLPFYDFDKLISSSEDTQEKMKKVFSQMQYEYQEIKKILENLHE